ncbi:YolD-like family protein [Staphylococcus auricularis]|uniref:YolD-like family protein n=1 Tax=Staphylococcus auricularis TaxID=29379 RepID=A0ABX5IDX0_9STAP|nr:YolD-like family protein [Staphylococcus auricularis]MCE5039100.1 YolD-like family protein [Staphylococcus auricularis]MEB6570897.1 YolD-like family protein [Staphylococcus auricularis]PTH13705.1 YolD-like family protein [Staphylococcus auricularis]
MIPERYKHETDYRKIPRQYLNPNIPKGRGMVKWQPFATLPEQFERLKQYVADQDKIERPVLSDDQLHELNLQLHQALHQNDPVQIEYYEEGWINDIDMYIIRIDTLNMVLEGKSCANGEKVCFSLFDVMRIHPL